MRIRKRLALPAVAVAIALAALLPLLGRPLLLRHISRATGRQEVAVVGCWHCHGRRPTAEIRRGLPHPEPRFLAVSADGRRLYVTCGPIRSLAVIDLESRRLGRMQELSGRPGGLAMSPDGRLLCVSLRDRQEVVVLDADSLEQLAAIRVGLEPAGLAFAGGGRRLFVANAASHDVSVVDLEAGSEVLRVASGREPFAIASSPDGRTIAVLSRRSEVVRPDGEPASELTLLDAGTGAVRARLRLPSTHLGEDLAFTPDGSYLLAPAVRVRNRLPILQVARGWVMSSVLVVVDLAAGQVALLPLGDVNTRCPDPSGIALAPDGRTAFVASGGVDRISVVDIPSLLELQDAAAPDEPEHFAWASRYVRRRFPVGDNPRDVAAIVLAGQMVLAVAERLDDTVALLDPAGALLERIPVGSPVREDAVHRGDRLFHDASYAFQAAFSCRSCHPGGDTDGLTYDFDIDGVGRNVVLNRSLRGVAGTAPFKWNGLNPTLARQCGPRFAMVLTRADPFPEEQLEDLVAYLQSLPPPVPDPGAGRIAGRDLGAVARGADIFARSTRKDGSPIPPSGRCVTCHPPPLYSNLLKADVGTQGPFDDSAAFDVPHLVGIGSKAPYLHDGRAATLEEIWTQPGVLDRHGVVTDLSKADLNDLVAFLRSL